MKYTLLDSDCGNEIAQIKTEPFDLVKCSEHPSYFSHHFLGITPYRYQHAILRRFKDGSIRRHDRIMVCKPRQIGISVAMQMLAIWFAINNKRKSGTENNCKIGIISKEDRAAKKMMSDIQSLVLNNPKLKDFVKHDQRTPLNKTEICFTNGAWIKCFPPTKSVRGNTFDLMIIDEAAFVEDEIYREVLEPCVSASNGLVIMASTPNGQKGFFFDFFDPFDLYKQHEYIRYWFHWKQCENENQKKLIKRKYKYSKAQGNLKSFSQEYEALFTVDKEAFFDDEDVEKGRDANLTMAYEYHGAVCSIGVDYGMKNTQTTVTVVKYDKEQDKIITLFQFGQFNFDENLLMDTNWEHSIPNLIKRYSVEYIVVDDCAQGTRTNKQLENEGYPLVRFNFRSDQSMGERNRGYYLFRSALRLGKIKYPDIRQLINEMKMVQESKVESGLFMRIKAPVGEVCDRIDGLMMACYPFITEQSNFSSTVLEYKKVIEDINKTIRKDCRFDKEWEDIKLKEIV